MLLRRSSNKKYCSESMATLGLVKAITSAKTTGLTFFDLSETDMDLTLSKLAADLSVYNRTAELARAFFKGLGKLFDEPEAYVDK